MAAKKKRSRVQSNLRRCPLLKITIEEVEETVDLELDKDGKPKLKDGKPVGAKQTTTKRTIQEFNECYKTYCMAWQNNNCTYFDTGPGEQGISSGEEEE